MHRLGTPVFGAKVLRSMAAHLGPDRLRHYLVSYGGRPIGGMLCVVHGSCWTDLYAIVRRLPDVEFANYLLYWHVIRDAASLGVEQFDLGRSAPGSTVHAFKRKWGGQDVDVPYAFFRGDRASGRPLGLFSETRRQGVAQRVWTKLPLSFCNVAGPLIRRELPFL
jgi:hypothetical protein